MFMFQPASSPQSALEHHPNELIDVAVRPSEQQIRGGWACLDHPKIIRAVTGICWVGL